MIGAVDVPFTLPTGERVMAVRATTDCAGCIFRVREGRYACSNSALQVPHCMSLHRADKTDVIFISVTEGVAL